MKLETTRALYRYWDRLRAGRAAPERSDLDPGAIRTLLGDVFLLEIAASPRHRVRLAGTRICTLLGRELRAQPFAHLFAVEERGDLETLLDGVCATAIPVVAGVIGQTPDGRRLDLELLVLPLRHRGRTHARLLGSLVCEERPYWAGLVPLERFHLVSVRHLAPEGAETADPDLVSPAFRRSPPGRLRVVPGGRP